MVSTSKRSQYNFPGQTQVYHGKVRDVYTIHDKLLVMIASDRISAFDVILPKPVPFKGQVLNQIAEYFLTATRDITPNWLLSVPDPKASIGLKCEPVKIEMVIRGYLSGHAWREYNSGKRIICGEKMPEGLKQSDAFPDAIITPTTKAATGHDEDISKDEIIKQSIVSAEDYAIMEHYTKKLFERGTKMAKERGLILVDTKYEFGKYNNEIYLMDEVHTPDSSRYFYADGYAERQKNNEAQKQISKEFVREWLIANNFMGKENETVPDMPDGFVQQISNRYIELYEKVTGKHFVPSVYGDSDTYRNIIMGLEKLYHLS
ncbi:MAG: phosphoribosylaminoimidazolesuccinocarboxamide synthase [Fimbriimonadaceae bacterium]|nr:phosphoribosylaminoimidazolesuccinocarboxamide synthase [Chitinophagales bacterium]